MGLDTSHNCWHGAYSAFHRWRTKLAEIAGLPPLELMEGFFFPERSGNPFWMQYQEDKKSGFVDEYSVWARLPIKWDLYEKDPLTILLRHSDCDGEIEWQDCEPIADRLEELLPKLPKGEAWGHIGNWKDKTSQFIEGLRKAFKAKENVDFH
jgi:hypothetical protein